MFHGAGPRVSYTREKVLRRRIRRARTLFPAPLTMPVQPNKYRVFPEYRLRVRSVKRIVKATYNRVFIRDGNFMAPSRLAK